MKAYIALPGKTGEVETKQVVAVDEITHVSEGAHYNGHHFERSPFTAVGLSGGHTVLTTLSFDAVIDEMREAAAKVRSVA